MAQMAFAPQLMLYLGVVVVSFLPTAMFIAWVNTKAMKDAGIGGFKMGLKGTDMTSAWQYQNLHPLCMTLAVGFMMSSAIVTFRVAPFSRKVRKGIHGLLHSLAVVLLCIGLTVEERFKKEDGDDHFFTIHALLGLTTIILVFGNYLTAVVSFVFQIPGEDSRKKIAKFHVLLGVLSYLCGGFAMASGFATRLFISAIIQVNPALNIEPRNAYWQTSAAFGFMLFLVYSIVLLTVGRFSGPSEHEKESINDNGNGNGDATAYYGSLSSMPNDP